MMNNNSPVKPYFKRVMVVLLVMFALLIALAVRLLYIQVFQRDEYRSKAFDQYTTEMTISPKRGIIYDRNMTPLAVSATVETVFISPYEILEEDEDKIADYLSQKLGVNRAEIVERMSRKQSKYQIIKKKVDTAITDEIRKFIEEEGVKGIHLEEDTKRLYPHGNLASNLIGFTNSENVGIYGVESYYENYLKGNPGKIITAQNAKGRDMPFANESYYGAENGTNVVLTIDWQVQSVLEKHLAVALEDTQARNRVLGIIMDVNTGDILAMSTKPDYDPNNPYDLDEEMQLLYDEFKSTPIENEDGRTMLPTEEQQNQFYKDLLESRWKNKAVTETYEPGSTFKLVTSAIALEENLAMTDPGHIFTCTGSKHVGGFTIGCHQRGGHGEENFEQGLQNSCNPVFMELAMAVGREKFYDYFESFGFMEKTGVDIAGEVDSIYHNKENFGITSLATYSFGQTFRITPISLIRAVSAVANGGNLMEPRIVKALVDEDGNAVKEFEPKVVRQVNSPETSKEIMKYLENGITIGSTKNAYVKGYNVGAKTGTSEKRDMPEGYYVASCVAFAPANDPEIAILIVIDEPVGNYYGGTVAAPVVSSVLTEVLPYLGVETSTKQEGETVEEITVSDYTGLSVSGAKTTLKGAGLTYKIHGEGNVVVDQYPKYGTRLRDGGVVVLYTEHNEEEQVKVIVPDVTQYTPDIATKTLVNASLNIKMEGAYRDGVDGTVATRQNPEPGTEVVPGTTVSVEFHHLDNSD